MEREESERLTIDLPQVLGDYKSYCVRNEMEKCLAVMQTSTDEEERSVALKKFIAYKTADKVLAKILGERIIK